MEDSGVYNPSEPRQAKAFRCMRVALLVHMCVSTDVSEHMCLGKCRCTIVQMY